MRKIFLFFLFLFATGFTSILLADCTLVNNDVPSGTRLSTGSGTVTYGQSFIPCQTGFLSSLLVNTDGGDLKLYLVQGDLNAVDLSQPIQEFPSTPAGDVTLTLNPAFKLTGGILYSFAIGNTDGILFDWAPNSNRDFDGEPFAPRGIQAFSINGGSRSNIATGDLLFVVNISTTDPFLIPIPTFSQWGILNFSLLLLNLGIFFIYRRQSMVS